MHGIAGAIFHNPEANFLQCDILEVVNPIIVTWNMSGLFLVTLIVILICYGLIAKLAFKLSRDSRSQVGAVGGWVNERGVSGSDSRSASIPCKLKALKAPVVVAGLFCLCWMAYPIVNILTTLQVSTLKGQSQENNRSL